VDSDNDVGSVGMYYMGSPAGFMLHDGGMSGDFVAGDGVWAFTVSVIPGVPAGEFLLELVAVDAMGNMSMTYPCAHIH